MSVNIEKQISRRQFLFGRSFADDECGATIVEYGILSAAIAFAGYSALHFVGRDTKKLFRCVKDAVAQKSAEGKCSNSGGGGSLAGAKGS